MEGWMNGWKDRWMDGWMNNTCGMYIAFVICNPASSRVDELANRNAPITDDLLRLILSH